MKPKTFAPLHTINARDLRPGDIMWDSICPHDPHNADVLSTTQTTRVVDGRRRRFIRVTVRAIGGAFPGTTATYYLPPDERVSVRMKHADEPPTGSFTRDTPHSLRPTRNLRNVYVMLWDRKRQRGGDGYFGGPYVDRREVETCAATLIARDGSHIVEARIAYYDRVGIFHDRVGTVDVATGKVSWLGDG